MEDIELRDLVQAKLEWSHEQIAAWLRPLYPDRPGWHGCHATICQVVFRSFLLGLTVVRGLYLDTACAAASP